MVLAGYYYNDVMEITKNIIIRGENSGGLRPTFINPHIIINANITLWELDFSGILRVSDGKQVAGNSGYISVNKLDIGNNAKFIAQHLLIHNSLSADTGSVLEFTNANLKGNRMIRAGTRLTVKSSEVNNLHLTVQGTVIFENVTFKEDEIMDKPFILLEGAMFTCDNCKIISKQVPPAISATKSWITIRKSQILVLLQIEEK